MLWLDVSCDGDLKSYKKEFLKKEGAYFEIGSKCPRCEEEITLKHIEDLFGVHPASTDFRKEVIEYLNQYIKKRKNTDQPIHIKTCLRKAHFFAQVGAETLGINTDWIVETDVNPYTPANIRNTSIFGERSGILERRGQIETFCADRPQKRLLNFLYAHENKFGNGNGNEASGDGYRFRGRGLKQLTGRGNYRTASQTLKEIFPEEYIDLEANPDKVKEAKYAVLSAIAYWEKHEIWKTADSLNISSDANIQKIRALVNPGLAGWSDAKKYFEKGIQVFKVNECSPVESSSDGKWHDPLEVMEIRGWYGTNYNDWDTSASKFGVVPRRKSGIHQGIDLWAQSGTLLKACVSGKIVFDGNVGDYGQVIVLEGDYRGTTYYFAYAHLSKSNYDSVDVSAGDPIAFSGKSGNASSFPTKAQHLHFEVRTKKNVERGLNDRLDPIATISELTNIEANAKKTTQK